MRKEPEILNERSCELLALLIKTYIMTGEPVGSRVISKLTRAGLSPATVRNTVGELEDAGYLEQPHTSAGRIPSNKGYRFYVDHILEPAHLSNDDVATIQQGLIGEYWDNADELMARATHVLSAFSNAVGVVVLPTLQQDNIKHIDFVKLNDGRILVITVLRTGFVQDQVIRIEENLSQDELNSTARYINENFAGYSLAAIRKELLSRLSAEKDFYDRLLQSAILIFEEGLKDSGQESAEVFVEGTSNMVTKREFTDKETIRQLLHVFEEKRRLVKLLNDCIAQDALSAVGVRIGTENSLPSLHGCTIVSSCYSLGGQVIGSLGVVGSVRMEYARMIGVVNYTARLLEQVLLTPSVTVI